MDSIEERPKDKYDLAVDYLTKNPDKLIKSWEFPESYPSGCLFAFAGQEPLDCYNGCGCLTQVRYGMYPAETPELTDAIRRDERIPIFPDDIKPSDLPVFAEWQRRLDLELGRVWPEETF
jgi:hypothetical protein